MNTTSPERVEVMYPTYTTISITVAERDVLQALYEAGRPIHAIKFLRAQYGLGLKAAKDICDSLRRPGF